MTETGSPLKKLMIIKQILFVYIVGDNIENSVENINTHVRV